MATSPQSAPICEVSSCSKAPSSKAVKLLAEERFDGDLTAIRADMRGTTRSSVSSSSVSLSCW